MSVYLTPVTFEGAFIAPSDDGAAWAACMTDGISSGCALSLSGTTLTIAAGKIVVAGRTARVDAAKTFTTSNNYSRLVCTVDLSKTASEQIALDIESASSTSGFAALTQNDINNGGTKYQFEICLVSGNSIVWQCGRAHSKGYGYQVTLQSGVWDNNNRYNIWANGVLSGSNVIITPDPSSQATCDACGVYAVSQSDRIITFGCSTVPSSDVKMNILLY